MPDIDLPSPGEDPNWAPKLNTAVQKVSDAVDQVPDQVDGLVEVALADSEFLQGAVQSGVTAADIPGQVGAAVTTEVAGRDLIEGSDPRVARSEPSASYTGGFRNKVSQMLAGVRADNGRWGMPTGAQFKTIKASERDSDTLSVGFVGANGRIGQLRMDKKGMIPLDVINELGTRIGNLWPFKPEPKKKVITVNSPAGGAGNYASMKLANDAIVAAGDASRTNWYQVKVFSGEYTEINWFMAPYTEWIGIGERENIHAKGELPDTATDAQIAANSTFWMNNTSIIRNIKVTARNMRYPIHSDGSGANPNTVQEVYNCHLEHYGNQGVISYRANNSLPAGSPWLSQRPWGCGLASGQKQILQDTVLAGVLEPFYYHTNRDFVDPVSIKVIRCTLILTGTNVPAITVQDTGSGTPDELEMIDCIMPPKYITHHDPDWLTTDIKKMYAHADSRISIAGGLVGYSASSFRKRAIRIASASTALGSKVRVSGDAAPYIFGATTYRDIGGGIASYAYGDLDISGIQVGQSGTTNVDNTLGRRLGDCSTVNKTLAVAVDGGATVNVVFNTNLTAASNDDVFAIINGVLGSSATASSYNVPNNEYYPLFPREGDVFYNASSSVAIPRWTAVKIVGGKISPFGVADDSSLFAGVTLFNVAPAGRGRIARRGLFSSVQLAGGPTITVDTPIYLSETTAGSFTTAPGTLARKAGVGLAAPYAQIQGAR